MLKINISMETGNLDSLRAGGLAALAAKAAAESYAESILDDIGAGKSFTSRHGAAGLEGSIGWRPDGNGAVVYAQKLYAPYVEYGTGEYGPLGKPYVIQPKQGGGRKQLRRPISGGGYLFNKLLVHHGMKAKPFFSLNFDQRKEKSIGAAQGILAKKLAGII